MKRIVFLLLAGCGLVAGMGPAAAQTVIKGREVPQHELSMVQAQCDTLLARERSGSDIEFDPDPNEAIVPRGNAHMVRSTNLETLTVWDCRRAGLI